MPDRTTRAGSPHPPSTGAWSDSLRVRLAPLALPPAREREIIDELSQHLDERYEELRAGGVDEAEARRPRDRRDCASRTRSPQQMRPLRQAPRAPPICAGAPAAPAASAISGRTCATPRACCASSPASPPRPS